jgi:hypothetical protein
LFFAGSFATPDQSEIAAQATKTMPPTTKPHKPLTMAISGDAKNAADEHTGRFAAGKSRYGLGLGKVRPLLLVERQLARN